MRECGTQPASQNLQGTDLGQEALSQCGGGGGGGGGPRTVALGSGRSGVESELCHFLSLGFPICKVGANKSASPGGRAHSLLLVDRDFFIQTPAVSLELCCPKSPWLHVQAHRRARVIRSSQGGRVWEREGHAPSLTVDGDWSWPQGTAHLHSGGQGMILGWTSDLAVVWLSGTLKQSWHFPLQVCELSTSCPWRASGVKGQPVLTA